MGINAFLPLQLTKEINAGMIFIIGSTSYTRKAVIDMNHFLYEDIVIDLQDQIETGKLLEGEKLPSERMMVESYGVSRNVVREALKVLSEKGMIEIKPGKGAYVNIIDNEQLFKKLELAVLSSKSTLLEILEVREMIEKGIIIKAVERATKKDIQNLRGIYDKMQTRLATQVNFAGEDAIFHEALAKCTGNKMLEVLVKTFYTITDKKLFLVSQLYAQKVIAAQQEHRAIIEAIEENDMRKGLDAISSHMQGIREALEGLNQ